VGTERETDDVGVVKASEEVDLCPDSGFVSLLMTLRVMWWMDEPEGVLPGSERLEECLQKVSLRLMWFIFFYATGNLQPYDSHSLAVRRMYVNQASHSNVGH